MPIEIIVPRLGWSMNEATFADWLKHDGEVVQEGEMLFTLESDKATQDVETFDAGILRLPPDSPKVGDVVQVGQVIGYLCGEDEAPPVSLPASATTDDDERNRGPSTPDRGQTGSPLSAARIPAARIPAARITADTNSQITSDFSPVAGPAARRLARERGVDLTAIDGTGRKGRITRKDIEQGAGPTLAQNVNASSGRIRVSPRAARKAAELGVALTQVQGTGRQGRIRERDVLEHSRKADTRFASAFDPARVGATPTDASAAAVIKLREIIAGRVLAASQQTAAVTLTSRVDATNLVALRSQFGQSPVGDRPVPSYTDLFIKLSALAMSRHAEVRYQWTDDGLVMPAGIHISVAVQTHEGLLVPVLRNVDRLSLSEVSRQMLELIEKTRSRRISPDELRGGVFTISNLGGYRIDAFTPILNLPQAAILGIGRISKEPAVYEGEITARDVVTLSLTFDHRVIDGAPAAKFLDTLVQLVELPAPSLIG
jgi:pyruvate dehydrogenase E2 component (dihydrolipoamide acetyltransferase)